MKRYLNFRLFPASLLAFSVVIFACRAGAETLQAKGIVGYVDSKGRSPELGVEVVRKSSETISILASAAQLHEDYEQYPMRYDFYVNRRLFSSQVQSPELPGAVGVDIGPDIATVPFNYMVVASTISPDGRPFSSVISGAVYESNLQADLVCNLSFDADTESEVVYTDGSLSTSQNTNDSFELNFSGENTVGENATAVGLVNISGSSASANLSVTRGSADAQAINFSGSLSFASNSSIERLSLSSSDSSIEILCTN